MKQDPSISDPLLGRRVAERFVIRSLIARGAMGRVYEAEQVPLGRRVAVKFLDVPDHGDDTASWVERFQREAASLAALTSPHTVRIIDYGRWERHPYLVMEFVDGQSLARLLRGGPIAVASALEIALQICDSLREAHGRGLVHRDLKPDNVLITRTTERRVWVKLIDWGLVKQVGSEEERTATNMLLGTPSYMAPELIRGGYVDGRIDLYALGVVLFRMLSGKKPFVARTTTAGVLLNHLQDPPIRLSDAAPHLLFPDILEAILERALQKRADDRYTSAAEMTADLEFARRIVHGEATHSTGLRDLSGMRGAPFTMSGTAPTPTVAPPSSNVSQRRVMPAVATGLLTAAMVMAGLTGWVRNLAELAPLQRTEVTDAIQGDTTWTADRVWVLTDPVFVESGTLTIEAGTRVEGREGAALVITMGAALRARGRPDAPIVFTSARPVGDRSPGDWGGLVLLGQDAINTPSGVIEGVVEGDARGRYGGDTPDTSCGVLEYVRVEFAGYEVYANNELNGLTLGGCGRDTIVRYVQVHRTLDDGVELFGGTVDLSNLVISHPGDDGLDWDQGWTGRLQFMVVQMGSDVGDSAIEADNNAETPEATPRSAPQLSHVTLIGSPGAAQRAITLRSGTAGTIRNVLARGFDRELVDIRDPQTAAQARSGELTLGPVAVFQVGDADGPFPREANEHDDDGGLDEARWASTVLTEDQQLMDGVFDAVHPVFTPRGSSPVAEGAAGLPDDEFWDPGATWLGAVRPGSDKTWLDGWTAFPED